MNFSKEDNAAWDDSEIIKEFEKIAYKDDIINGPPIEAYQPIKMEEVDGDEVEWEDEEAEAKLMDAIDKLEISEEKEINLEENTNTANLIENLQKIASNLALGSKMKAAYIIERAILEIKNIYWR